MRIQHSSRTPRYITASATLERCGVYGQRDWLKIKLRSREARLWQPRYKGEKVGTAKDLPWVGYSVEMIRCASNSFYLVREIYSGSVNTLKDVLRRQLTIVLLVGSEERNRKRFRLVSPANNGLSASLCGVVRRGLGRSQPRRVGESCYCTLRSSWCAVSYPVGLWLCLCFLCVLSLSSYVVRRMKMCPIRVFVEDVSAVLKSCHTIRLSQVFKSRAMVRRIGLVQRRGTQADTDRN